MTLDDLRNFLAVCDAGSLSAVARDRGVSQSAVSQQVRRLERDLGLPLFERGRRGVLPTAAGRVLLDGVRESLASLDVAVRRLDRLRSGDVGALRIATGGTTLRHFMIRPLAMFRRHHPGITFEYVSASSTSQCLDAVRRDRADLAYVTIAAEDSLHLIPTVRTQWVLVVASDDPLAQRRDIPVSALRDIRAIAMPSHATSRSQLENQLAEHHIRLNFAATVDDWDTAVRLAELGVGHAIVPALWVHDLDKHRRLRALPIRALEPVTFGWAARTWDALPDYAKTFAAIVDEGIASLGPAARVELVS